VGGYAGTAMSTELLYRVESLRSEAVELKHLVAWIREWKGARGAGREWTLSGSEIRFGYEGASTKELCNWVHCTVSSRQSVEDSVRGVDFITRTAEELGWRLIEPDL
jgi:hypothetical protein